MGQIEKTGGPGERGIHVAFWGVFFFFSSAILAKVQKGVVREKQAPPWNGWQLFTGLLAAHMSEVFRHMAV